MAQHKMKRRTKIILASVATVAIIGGFTAKWMHGGPEARAAHVISHIEDEFNLDSSQVQALTDLKVQLFDIGSEIKSSRNENFQAALDLLSQPELDQAQALALIEAKTSTVNDKAPEMIAAIANFTDQLTPVQKQQMLEKANKRLERWNKRH